MAEKNDVDLFDILQQYMSEHPTRGEVAIVDHIRSLGFRVKRKKLREQVGNALTQLLLLDVFSAYFLMESSL